MWETVGIIPDEHTLFDILDIACGCAIKSFVLAQKSKKITVTCLDSEKVLEVAFDLAERMNLLLQVKSLPGDLLKIEFGKAKYDLCLLGQITHYLTEAQNQNLFQRIYAALKDRGILAIDVPMDRGTLDEETTLLTLTLWSNGGGTAYSFSAYQSWLENAGFRKITQLSDRLLKAEK
jgi:SAM-dependent methyltransferase